MKFLNLLSVMLLIFIAGCSGRQSPDLDTEDGSMVSEVKQSEIMKAGESKQMPKGR